MLSALYIRSFMNEMVVGKVGSTKIEVNFFDVIPLCIFRTSKRYFSIPIFYIMHVVIATLLFNSSPLLTRTYKYFLYMLWALGSQFCYLLRLNVSKMVTNLYLRSFYC